MFSKWTGVAANKINELFMRASQNRPAIIFIDELEAFLRTRESPGESESSSRVKTQILELTGSELCQVPGIFVICGTNHPQAVDGAFANRIDRTILLRLPTQEHKYLFFKQYLEKEGIDTTVTKEEFNSIETDRFSYRDLDSWFKAAIDDGPYLRDEDSQHYKYVSQQNRSDYLIGCDCSEADCFKITKDRRNRFPGEMFKYTALSFQDLLTTRDSRVATATEEEIEGFEHFLLDRKLKEKPEEESKEPSPTVSYYSCSSFVFILIVILFLIIIAFMAFSVVSA